MTAIYRKDRDSVRIFIQATGLDGRKIRLSHQVNPRQPGTIEERRKRGERIVKQLEGLFTRPVDLRSAKKLLTEHSTPELIRMSKNPAEFRARCLPARTVAEHFEHSYQPTLRSSKKWQKRELSMMKNHVFCVRVQGAKVAVGEMSPLDVQEDHLRDIKQSITEKRERSDISTKYAQEIDRSWRAYVQALSDSDSRIVRLRHDNPTAKVRPLGGGKRPDLQWLYPTEAWALFKSADPEWGRAWFFQIILNLRPSEVSPLTAAEVRLEQGLVRVWQKTQYSEIHKRWEIIDYTKSKQVRWVQIPPLAEPLLRALMKARPTGSLFPVMANQHNPSHHLRVALKKAQVIRPELFNAHTGSKRLRAHDLRATGATWYFLAGYTEDDVRRRLGHTDKEMTGRYIRDRAEAAQMVGNPFELDVPERLFMGIGLLPGLIPGGPNNDEGSQKRLPSDGSGSRARTYHGNLKGPKTSQKQDPGHSSQHLEHVGISFGIRRHRSQGGAKWALATYAERLGILPDHVVTEQGVEAGLAQMGGCDAAPS